MNDKFIFPNRVLNHSIESFILFLLSYCLYLNIYEMKIVYLFWCLFVCLRACLLCGAYVLLTG